MSTIASEPKVDAAAIDGLERVFRDSWFGRGTRVRRAPAGLERIDRSIAGPDRALRRRGRRHRSGEICEGHGPVISVRGGGHSFPGLSVCNGGIVIDLGLMKGIRVDPEIRTARAEAGVSLVSSNGRPRRSGWPCPPASSRTRGSRDSLSAAGSAGWNASTGSGSINCTRWTWLRRRASREGERPDTELFWGVRGGGGNFGIVTSSISASTRWSNRLAGPIFWPMEESPKVMRFYRDWIAEAPDI